jgi:hypothetical protein
MVGYGVSQCGTSGEQHTTEVKHEYLANGPEFDPANCQGKLLTIPTKQ